METWEVGWKQEVGSKCFLQFPPSSPRWGAKVTAIKDTGVEDKPWNAQSGGMKEAWGSRLSAASFVPASPSVADISLLRAVI